MTNPLSLVGAVGVGNPGQPSAGTTQETASPMISDHVWVPEGATADSGVILNAGNGGEQYSVGNGNAAVTIRVYPPVGASFNGSAANTYLALPPQRAAFFIFLSPTKINAIY